MDLVSAIHDNIAYFMFYVVFVFKIIYLTLSVVFLKIDILQNSAVHNFKTVIRNCMEFSGNVNDNMIYWLN